MSEEIKELIKLHFGNGGLTFDQTTKLLEITLRLANRLDQEKADFERLKSSLLGSR